MRTSVLHKFCKGVPMALALPDVEAETGLAGGDSRSCAFQSMDADMDNQRSVHLTKTPGGAKDA